ncbi:hypothetical protein GS416_09490 [Rhodococcus hoagii]|nr:hypothetical protein [Prescottella equi]
MTITSPASRPASAPPPSNGLADAAEVVKQECDRTAAPRRLANSATAREPPSNASKRQSDSTHPLRSPAARELGYDHHDGQAKYLEERGASPPRPPSRQ